MKFSVVIPVYNVGDYLETCVRSVLVQAITDYEIILVDDGSTDGICPAMCDRFAAQYPERVRVIHKPNGGLGDARNVGLEASTGEYVLFLDSDDTIAPQTLTVLTEALAVQPDVVTFGYELVRPDGSREPHPTELPFGRMLCLNDYPGLLLGAPSACTRLWRRTLFDDGIRYPSRVWYEDIRTTGKLLARAQRVIALPDCLYGYQVCEGSIMRNRNLDRNHEIIDAMDDLLGWFRAEGLFERYREELCALTTEHVLLAASVRVARVDPRHPLLAEFARYTEENFPDYAQNRYLKRLPRGKRLALRLVRHRKFRMLRFLFSINK